MTVDQFLKKTGADRGNTIRHWDSLQAAMEQYQIDTPWRRAAFLSNILHETGNFHSFIENMNYSWERLITVWPHRFTRESAIQFEHHPEQIANLVYAGRMGNTEQTDGWRFRGRGMIQITGRDAYRAASLALGFDFIENPDAITEPPYAARSAAMFWSAHKLNPLADAGKIRAIRVTINGGLHGFDEVKAIYEKLLT